MGFFIPQGFIPLIPSGFAHSLPDASSLCLVGVAKLILRKQMHFVAHVTIATA